MSQSPSTNDALAALERFVVDNDELLVLEEHIGRLNIFDALRIARTEIRHSNFLAWLLDPAESHGQGSLFLRAVLMDILRNADPAQRPLNPIDLDGTELRGVEIRREWRHIDLLILCREPQFVIAVENKVDSGEHSSQLKNYRRVLNEEFPDWPRMFLFLTIDGDEPSDDEWVPYSYADLHRALERCRRTNARSIGDDVLVFVDHYLRLIGSRFMDDPKIDELCRRIYQNHRQALELIFERCSVGSGPINMIVDLVSNNSDRWHVFKRTSRMVYFAPTSWQTWLPQLGTEQSPDPQFWIYCWFAVAPKQCSVYLVGEVGPCKNPELRRNVLDQLVRIGFGKSNKKYSPVWTRFHSEKVLKWSDNDEPPADDVAIEVVQKSLDRLWDRLEKVPSVLQPLFVK